MTANTSFFSVCCALARGNSSRVITFSSTPPKLSFAMNLYLLLLVYFIVLSEIREGGSPLRGGIRLPGAASRACRCVGAPCLHTKDFVLLVEILIFDDFFAGFGEFEVF